MQKYKVGMEVRATLGDDKDATIGGIVESINGAILTVKVTGEWLGETLVTSQGGRLGSIVEVHEHQITLSREK